MPRHVALLALCCLAACGRGRGFLVVTVDSQAPLVVDELDVTVSTGATTAPLVIVPASGDLSTAPVTFSLQFDDPPSGPVHVAVAAMDKKSAVGNGQADATVPASGVQNVTVTIAGSVVMADMAMPDAAAPDMAVVDEAQPDEAMPDLAKPDLEHPDLKMPDLAMPDLAMPDLAKPDLAMPDLATPDFAMPDFAMPDLSPYPDLAVVPTVMPYSLSQYPPAPPNGVAGCAVDSSGAPSSSVCPAIFWGDQIYLTYIDTTNAADFFVLAFKNSSGHAGPLSMGWPPFNGTRYIWEITIDYGAQTFTFHGQGGLADAVVPWSMLRIDQPQ